MLDIKLIRTNPELVKEAMRKRKKEIDIDALLALDVKRRELIYTAEQKKAEQNQKNKLVVEAGRGDPRAAALDSEHSE